MKKYIIGIDEGTTSTRAGIYDITKNKIIKVVQKPLKLIFPKSGWVEQDAIEIWKMQLDCIKEVIKLSKINVDDIISMGITNQRETVVAWDSITGEPLANTICWQCRRTAETINKLTQKQKDFIKQETGLIADAYFSGPKIAWLLEHNAKVRSAYEKKTLMIGNIDTFLAYKLTGNFVTDSTNASRTMLYNLKTNSWDKRLFKLFNIPADLQLAKIISCNDIIGETNLFGKSIVVAGMLGDQQSALFGQCCFNKGMAKSTYGTGNFILMNIGNEPKYSDNLLTDVAYAIDGKITYALEGSVFNCGSTVQWIRDQLKIIKTSPQTEKMAYSVDSTNGVYVIPAFTGLGSPYWNSDARAAIIGINRDTNRNHIARAVLEGMAFRAQDLLVEMRKSTPLKEMRCDGGASNNNFLMEFQSNISNIKLLLPKKFESTLMGAIYMSALATKTIKNISELSNLWQEKKQFLPNMDAKERKNKYSAWKEAINRVL